MAPPLPVDELMLRSQYAVLFKRVEHWVKRPRAKVIAVSMQLFHHFKPEDRSFRRVMKNMHTSKGQDEVPLDLRSHHVGHISLH